MPPAAINIDVPKSGWVMTKSTGEIKATIGIKINLNLLTSLFEIRW